MRKGKTRKLSTLYGVLLDNTTPIEFGYYGICWNIATLDELTVTKKEQVKLSNHFMKQRPSNEQYKEFFIEERKELAFWWCLNDSTIRVKFLRHLKKECRKQRL